jgi:endonuclease G
MADEEFRLEQVKARLSDSVREAVNDRITNRDFPPALLASLSEAALETVATDRAPLESAAPLAALEAIVQLTGRPPLRIRNNAVVMEPLPDLPVDTEVKIRDNEKWIPSVGRIEFLNAAMRWGGTGWVFDARPNGRLIITNRHVAKLVAKRAADGSGVFIRNTIGVPCGANIDFLEEEGSVANDASRTLKVTRVEYLADDLSADAALLLVEAGGFPLPTPMVLADKEAITGELVALIGYPAFDPRNDANAQANYFGGLYDVKRFAPGKVLQALSGETVLSHDCTSLGGNSGSPLLSLEQGKVVGLHFAGIYGKENSAVGVATLKALHSGVRPLVAVAGAPPESLADGNHDAAHFQGRKGFDTSYLHGGRIATPWPVLSAAAAASLAQPSDSPTEPGELRYTHFGVKYSREFRLPLMTGVNINGAKAVRIKRGQDKWFSDGRIDPAIQLRAANFADGQIDRGHMVRREDPNWGTAEQAELANADTFHYVNAAPQHSLLNQGKTLWQGLENYILDSARTSGFAASVFTGPVLGDEDETLDGARVPLEFWKLVATLDETGKKLHATAYLLSQGQLIRDLMQKRSRTEAMEGVVLGEYRTFQIAIADLASATGYDFSAYLAADPLGRTDESVEAASNDAPKFVPLDELSNMVL